MKPRILSTARLSIPLASAIAALLAAHSASGAVYYWDDNAAGANFGTAGASLGTWAGPTTGPVAGWSLSGTGANAFASFTTATTDTVNFGNGATGLAAGTITVSGTVNTGNMTFASGSGAITLSGGVINLGGSRTITSNYTAGVNATRTITSEIALSGASIFRIGEIGLGGGTRQVTLGKLSGTGGTTFEYAGGNNGFGVILLNQASTYTGTTTISTTLTNANTEVRLGVIDALPTTTIVTLAGNNGTGTGGRDTKLNLNGKNQTLAGLATTGGGAERNYIISSSTAATLTVNDAGNRTFAGLIGTDGTAISVTKQGAGNWTLSGANTYIGQTKVEGGTITVSNATALGTTAGNTVVSSGGRVFTGTTGISIAEAFNIAGTGTATNGAINIGGSATGVAFTGAITLAGNATIQGDGGTGTTFSGGIDLGANTLTFKESGTITVNTAAISGVGGSVVKNTGGQTNLNFANTYTGDTTVNAGILSLGVSAAAGVGGTISLGDTTGTNSATVTLSGTSTNVANALTVRTGSSGTKTLRNASGNSTTYSGNIAANDNLEILGAMTGTGTFIINGTGNTIAAGKTVSFSDTAAGSGSFSDNAIWSGDGATSYTGSSSTSSLVITGAKTYTGGSTVGLFSGTGVAVVATSSVGTGPGVTSGAFGTGNLTVGNGSRWRATTGSDITVGNTLTLAGDLVAITVASEKSLIFSGPATLTGTRTFDVSIGNTVAGKSLTFSGAIGESGGPHGITKTGTGNMVLSGDNSYAGATLISAGTLTLSDAGDINSSSGITVNGSTAKFLQTSSVAVSPAVTLTQGTLTGNGTVDTVNVGAGTGGIISNNNGVAGAALTIGNLTLAGAANLNLFSNSFSSTLDITGTLTTAATPATLTVNNVGGWANGTPYTILTFGGGSIASSGDNFTKVINNLVTRQVGTWNTTSSAITLSIAGDNPVWSGANGGTWTTEATDSPTSGTPNWALKNGLTATDFWLGDTAEFNDTYDIGGGPVAPTTTAVDISTANVSPASTTFNNSSVNYTLGSTGGFGIASGSLTKNGGGSLTINNANTYTGTTTLNGGILRATTSAAALGAGTLTLAGGELQLANDSALSFGRNTTVTGNAQITSDTLTAVAGVTQTLGTLSIGGQTLTIAKGSLATGTTAGVTFGATTLTGTPTFSIGADSTLALAAVTNAGNTITLTGAGNFSQTGTHSGVGGLTLGSGFSGTATLSGASTNYSGDTTISGGKLVLSSTTAFASAVTVNAGTTLQYSPTGTNSQAGVGAISLLGTLAYAPAANHYQVLGTSGANKIVTVSGGASIINIAPGGTFAASTGGLYLDGGLQGSSNLTVNATTDGFGLVLRTTGSTYSGTMIVNGNASTTPGTGSGLVIGFLAASANATLPNANLTINGTLELGNSTSGMGWAAGTVSGQTFGMNALNGTGVIVANMQTAPSTRTISVGNNGGTGDFSGVIANGVNNTLGFTKAGGGTQTLSGLSATAADNYSGTTTIGGGTLAFTTTNPSLTGGLTFGATAGNTTTGALDLSAASATFGGALVVRTNTATANTIDIGAGQSLNLGNGMTVGFSSAANTETKLNVAGDGALNITAGNFQLGGSVASGFGNAATLDMSGLATFSYNVGASTFRVGDATNDSSGGTGSSTLILADTSTITALAFTMNSPSAAAHTVRLGSGVNTINANTINIGASSNRSPGTMNFNEATGSLIVRATDTTGRAAMTVAYGGATTAVVNTSSIDLTGAGHSADLLLSTLQIAGRTNGTQGAASTGTFSFGNGTLDATGVTVGVRAGTSGNSGPVEGTLNLGGGNVDIGASGLSVGLNTSSLAANTLDATVNISGSGTVDIGNTAGLSVTLGSSTNAVAGATTAALNLTGGTTTLTGDIRKGTATGAVTSTLTLNGASATLDMGGNDITDLTGITYTDGTLKNLGTVNTGMTLAGAGSRVFDQANGVNGDIQGGITGSGIGLDKQGLGRLTLSGTSSYSGDTTVTAGTLYVTGALSNSAVSVGANGTIGSNGVAGALGNGLTIGAGGDLDLVGATLALNSAGILSISGGNLTLGNLTFQDLVGWDWLNASNGTYELIDGSFTVTWGSTAYLDEATAYDFGNGKKGYFKAGSLNAVIIPEPSAALLGGLGLLALLRRRR